MGIEGLFFSFKGRIGRGQFWKGFLLLIGVGVLITFIAGAGGVSEDTMEGLIAAYGLATMVPFLALQVKRLHDRGKSGWFTLLGFIPFVSIWLAIELFLLSSEEGENKYGPEPA